MSSIFLYLSCFAFSCLCLLNVERAFFPDVSRSSLLCSGAARLDSGLRCASKSQDELPFPLGCHVSPGTGVSLPCSLTGRSRASFGASVSLLSWLVALGHVPSALPLCSLLDLSCPVGDTALRRHGGNRKKGRKENAVYRSGADTLRRSGKLGGTRADEALPALPLSSPLSRSADQTEDRAAFLAHSTRNGSGSSPSSCLQTLLLGSALPDARVWVAAPFMRLARRRSRPVQAKSSRSLRTAPQVNRAVLNTFIVQLKKVIWIKQQFEKGKKNEQ